MLFCKTENELLNITSCISIQLRRGGYDVLEGTRKHEIVAVMPNNQNVTLIQFPIACLSDANRYYEYVQTAIMQGVSLLDATTQWASEAFKLTGR